MSKLTETQLQRQLTNQVTTLDKGVMLTMDFQGSTKTVVLYSIEGWESKPLAYKKRQNYGVYFTLLTIETDAATLAFRSDWFYVVVVAD